jgi:hypothetical protein
MGIFMIVLMCPVMTLGQTGSGGGLSSYRPAVPPPTTNVYGGGGWGGYGGTGGGTAAGNALSGMSQAISAAGSYNLATSAAALNMTQVQHNDMANQQQWVNTFYEMRAAGRAGRAAERGPNLTAEQIARMARDGAPAALTPSQMEPVSGRLDWPSALQDPSFAPQRSEVDQLAAKRAEYGGLAYSDQTQFREAVDTMFDALKSQIREIPPQDYVACRSFLRSLLYSVTKTDL